MPVDLFDNGTLHKSSIPRKEAAAPNGPPRDLLASDSPIAAKLQDKDTKLKLRLERLATERPDIASNSSSNIAEALAIQEARLDSRFKGMAPAEQEILVEKYRKEFGAITDKQKFDREWHEARKNTFETLSKTEHVVNVIAGTAGRMIHGPIATAADAINNSPLNYGYDFPSIRKMVEDAYDIGAPMNPKYSNSMLLTKLPAGATSMAMFLLAGGAGGCECRHGHWLRHRR